QPRKINIMETLPQPLPQILSEGWLEVRADPRGWLLIFTSDGAFATGQSKLSEEFKKKRNIERLGDALAPWPGDLEVIGHTDNKPYRNTSNNSNLKLSEARAQTVADKLRESLANSKYNRTVTSVGKGDQEPLDDNATEEGRRRNRRVDILWKIGEREMASPSATLNQAGVAAEVPEDN
ncbi:OmpA family protein, partial [Serratia ureilytica]|uniref:OmpA family protein n=1 Tax=Serratia ureilytica TaxID=300181 RepID=UPI0018D9213F